MLTANGLNTKITSQFLKQNIYQNILFYQSHIPSLLKTKLTFNYRIKWNHSMLSHGNRGFRKVTFLKKVRGHSWTGDNEIESRSPRNSPSKIKKERIKEKAARKKQEPLKKNQSHAHTRTCSRTARTAGNEGQSFADVTRRIRIEVGKADEPSLLANQKRHSCVSLICSCGL